MPLKNSASFSYSDLFAIFGGEALPNIPEDILISGVSTDTRTIEKGNLYVPLKGEKFDGHDYIDQALEQEASAIVVSSDWLSNHDLENNTAYISAKDTLGALSALARYHRDRFNIPIVGIAGSNGKTTTKNILSHILQSKFDILSTEANYNNQIGVSLTVLQLEPKHEASVLELGTNQFGEISTLCDIAAPTHGLVTNIGAEHLEMFGDLDGVEMEETALIGWLMLHNGFNFINIDDHRLDKYYDMLEKKTAFSTEGKDADFSCIIADDNNAFIIQNSKDKNESYKVNSKARITAVNTVPCIAISKNLGMQEEEINEALDTFAQNDPFNGYGRMAIGSIGDITIINDTYNANSSSMKKALDTLNHVGKQGHKIAVLGDMRELGEQSQAEHTRILESANQIADSVYLYGEEFKIAERVFESTKTKHYDSKEDLVNNLISNIKNNSYVLFKGSRGLKMEEPLVLMANKLKEHYNNA
ncbi:MAG: UDP-N-acetylmuramoyl-tripeptide--D-alanyl-D-alanine ligase [Candidatus Kapaibacteriales bacterium]